MKSATEGGEPNNRNERLLLCSMNSTAEIPSRGEYFFPASVDGECRKFAGPATRLIVSTGPPAGAHLSLGNNAPGPGAFEPLLHTWPRPHCGTSTLQPLRDAVRRCRAPPHTPSWT